MTITYLKPEILVPETHFPALQTASRNPGTVTIKKLCDGFKIIG